MVKRKNLGVGLEEVVGKREQQDGGAPENRVATYVSGFPFGDLKDYAVKLRDNFASNKRNTSHAHFDNHLLHGSDPIPRGSVKFSKVEHASELR
jgi:hypothetical protein